MNNEQRLKRLSELQQKLEDAERDYKNNPTEENYNKEIIIRDEVEIYLKWCNNMNITDHFTRKEMTATNTGLYNEPSQSEFENLYDLCSEILEPVRTLLNCVIKITSGYRSEAVNKKVGSKAKKSQHISGSAADFIPVGMMLTSAFELIKRSDIQYDQLILENGWIHISYSKNPRRQAFFI